MRHHCAAVLRVHFTLTYVSHDSWGPSAGGSSVGSQLVANGGDDEGLFRAAVLSCGSLVPTGDLSNQQRFFDVVSAGAGCAGAVDKLGCLRGVPAENLTAAAAAIPDLFDYPVRVIVSPERL